MAVAVNVVVMEEGDITGEGRKLVLIEETKTVSDALKVSEVVVNFRVTRVTRGCVGSWLMTEDCGKPDALERCSINIDKLGASPGDTPIFDMLVVWSINRPPGGFYIVSWFGRTRAC
jgi:hypothetical protein